MYVMFKLLILEQIFPYM